MQELLKSLSYYRRPGTKIKTSKSYYYSHNVISDISQLVLMDKIKDGKIFKSDREVKPYQTDFGISFNQLKNTLGKPVFYIRDYNKISDYEIAFFKRKFLDTKFILQYHFYNGKLIVYSIIFYEMIQDEQKKKVLSQLFNKYAIEDALGLDSFTLMDSFDNVVFYEKGVNLQLNYFADIKNTDLLRKALKKMKDMESPNKSRYSTFRKFL